MLCWLSRDLQYGPVALAWIIHQRQELQLGSACLNGVSNATQIV